MIEWVALGLKRREQKMQARRVKMPFTLGSEAEDAPRPVDTRMHAPDHSRRTQANLPIEDPLRATL